MTKHEKRKKVATIAAAYYVLAESGKCTPCSNHKNWLKIGKEILMKNRTWIQSRGRFH